MSEDNIKKLKSFVNLNSLSTIASRNIDDSSQSDKEQLNVKNKKDSNIWTKKEDELLKKLIRDIPHKNWSIICNYLPGHSAKECYLRWNSFLKQDIIKGPWTPKEDALLIEWVNKNGPMKWTKCAEVIKGRTGKQCREHWNNCLNPNLKKGYWTDEEDYLILVFYQKYDGSWKKIIPIFKGRTENAIKNRFYSQLRKIAGEKLKKNEKNFQYKIKLDTLKKFLPYAIEESKNIFLKRNPMSNVELENLLVKYDNDLRQSLINKKNKKLKRKKKNENNDNNEIKENNLNNNNNKAINLNNNNNKAINFNNNNISQFPSLINNNVIINNNTNYYSFINPQNNFEFKNMNKFFNQISPQKPNPSNTYSNDNLNKDNNNIIFIQRENYKNKNNIDFNNNIFFNDFITKDFQQIQKDIEDNNKCINNINNNLNKNINNNINNNFNFQNSNDNINNGFENLEFKLENFLNPGLIKNYDVNNNNINNSNMKFLFCTRPSKSCQNEENNIILENDLDNKDIPYGFLDIGLNNLKKKNNNNDLNNSNNNNNNNILNNNISNNFFASNYNKMNSLSSNNNIDYKENLSFLEKGLSKLNNNNNNNIFNNNIKNNISRGQSKSSYCSYASFNSFNSFDAFEKNNLFLRDKIYQFFY